MKKLLLGGLILFLAVSLTACGGEEVNKEKLDNELSLSSSVLKEQVMGWTVYTNPMLRYELRHPKTWTWEKMDDAEREVTFKVGSDLVFKVKGFVNWKTEYSLEDYYKKEADKNLFEVKNKEITIAGKQAVWFENVVDKAGQRSEIIAMHLDDRILEITLVKGLDFEKAKTVLNSLKFY